MSRRKSRRLMNQINVVPYIDVTLVLLVIFMVTAPMTNPGVVELPQVGQTLKQTAAPIVITVKSDGKAEIESKVMERDQLLFEVKTQLEKTPDRAIVIAADKNVQYDKVITLMDSLKQYKVGLLLKPAN
ncbi:biopolymer transporter ExbD [Methylobacillus glycogenes]|uniref:biopolymer transporter ExbD n=1 Tax=Methylobacillus glycogenes TaxID=406 RepID=UPI0004715FAD|nr:biopolymer transporter ExbD [Methylobacillus glycogenes]MBL8505344.1 biopolymer transporter ExbD [Methylobacillus glycogenes]